MLKGLAQYHSFLGGGAGGRVAYPKTQYLIAFIHLMTDTSADVSMAADSRTQGHRKDQLVNPHLTPRLNNFRFSPCIITGNHFY